MAGRVYLTFSDEELKMLERAMKDHPLKYQRRATALKQIIFEALGIIDTKSQKHLTAPLSTSKHLTATTPDQGAPGPASPARARGRSSSLRSEDPLLGKKERERGGSAEGGVTAQAPLRLSSPDGPNGKGKAWKVTQCVIDRMNKLRPMPRGFTVEANLEKIGRLLKAGYSEDDLIAVVDHKAKGCKLKADWQWFKPSTLFRPTRFGDYLEDARANVPVGADEWPARVPRVAGERRQLAEAGDVVVQEWMAAHGERWGHLG